MIVKPRLLDFPSQGGEKRGYFLMDCRLSVSYWRSSSRGPVPVDLGTRDGAPNRAGPIPKLLRILRTVRSLKEPKEHLGAYGELSVRNPEHAIPAVSEPS